MKSVKLLIFGQVQGVGFRYWVRGKMRELGVDGDVWNNDDGTVGVEFKTKPEGSDPSNKLMELLKQGPALARVRKVVILK
ncbi:acylphosphatase [Candidatus Beckwithbacteria bacterium CG22_combo_CG10-13_8_21_14_all_01_47_9]|uniref:acylphosphatase n=2 Tax=Candidatus Beckwithiibacteriota TaxID=1752726 RepID=A0A2H0E064_9BACT|nr:MAG: acylphosphatase [Candidatus Beckwithbacteria bacterium CG22_combo_CG10-13_8_21_14_all_01_47_9]